MSPCPLERARQTRYDLGGRAICVFDGAIEERTIARVAAMVAGLPFARTETDGGDEQVYTEAAEVPSVVVAVEPLFSVVQAATATIEPAAVTPCRVYVNRIVPGDIVFPHRDCEPARSDVTALYYANPEWDRRWGGETVFFDDDGEARIAIAPRPGRLVAFHGAIEHRVGVPGVNCPVARLTIAYKVRVPAR